MVGYSHLFQNFPQFIVIHTVKGFGIVNKAEVDVFLKLFCFFNDQIDVGNLICGSSDFSLSSFTFIKKIFSFSLPSTKRMVSSAYLRLLIFLPAVLIPACVSSSPAFLMMYSA